MLKRLDDIQEIWAEIKACEKKIESEVVPAMREALSAYTGDRVVSGEDGFDVKLNDVFPIVQQKLPYLFFRNPRAFVKPRRKWVFVSKFNPEIGEKQKVRVDGVKLAKTTQDALNYSLHETGFEEQMDRISLDLALFPYTVMWQSYAGEFGIREDETFYIKSENIFQKRIRPDHFLWDIEGTTEEEWRWVGRKTLVRVVDVYDDPRYKQSVREKVLGKTGYGESIRRGGSDTKTIKPTVYSDFMGKDYQESVNSKRVWIYEIWKKPNLKQRLKNKKGKVYVFCEDSEEPLIETDWPLKQEGFPCEVFQINPLNDSLVGIPDPKTYISLADEKQLETNMIVKLMKQSSNLSVILNGGKFDMQHIEKFVSGESKALISNQPLAPGDVTPITPGSVPAAAFQVAQNTDLQLQKQSSITATRQGIKPPGEVTATQAEILEKGLESRPTLHQKLIARTLKKLARKRIQLMKQFFKKKDMVPILGTFDFEWSDEFDNNDITDEVDVEVDIQSMLPDNPALEIRNLLDMLKLMSDAISNPTIYQKILQEGKVFNFTPFIEQLLLRMNLRDEDMFRPVKPEEGEGYTLNADLLKARDETVSAVVQGHTPPPIQGEDHDAHLVIHEFILALLQELGQEVPSLQEHVEMTKMLQQQEEEESGKQKEGDTQEGFKVDTDRIPTRASEASRAQQRVS